MRLLLSFLALIIIGSQGESFAQGQVSKRNFDVYAFYYTYSKSTQEQLRNRGYVPTILMNKNYIDPGGKKGKADPKLVERFLNAKYRNKNADGVCVIDWEGPPFRVLQRNSKYSKSFKLVEQEYIELVKLIKKLRPNLKIGIYGLPFRVYRENQLKFNADNKFDRILSYCDFIAPSFYIMQPDLEVGFEKNISYLKTNLDIALKHGKRLNKPVIPFVWYRVHTSHPVYGGAVIPKDQMVNYMEYIESYVYSNRSVDGVFWWQSAGKLNPKGTLMRNQRGAPSHNDIIIDYTQSFMR